MERFILLICWSDKFVSLKRYMNISKLNWSSFCLFNGSPCVSICVWTLNAEHAHINKQSKWASIYIHIYADTKWHIRIQIITLSDYKCVDDLRLLPYPAFSVTHIISLREFLFSWDILLISSIPKHQFGTWHFSTSLSLSLVISFSFYIYESLCIRRPFLFESFMSSSHCGLCSFSIFLFIILWMMTNGCGLIWCKHDNF